MKNNGFESRIKQLEDRIKIIEEKFITKTDKEDYSVLGKKVKQVSEKEYLIEKNANNDVKRTFWLGKYLEEKKSQTSFTVEDLRNSFRLAKEPSPSNINDKINKLIRKGYFMEAEPKNGNKTWCLTATGEKLEKLDDRKTS